MVICRQRGSRRFSVPAPNFFKRRIGSLSFSRPCSTSRTIAAAVNGFETLAIRSHHRLHRDPVLLVRPAEAAG